MEKFQLKVLTWNIDGLDKREMDIRMKSICEIINLHAPDIVMLQEVVKDSLSILKTSCTFYQVLVKKKKEYFNIIMVRNDKDVKLVNSLNKIKFENTSMGRCLLEQELIFHNFPIFVCTSHLESLKEYSEERQNQLKICFSRMLSKNKKCFVIFGGDLNLRESELESIGGVPAGIKDSWIENGQNKETEFTWNLKLNDNKYLGAIQPTTRYDRLYFRSPSQGKIVCEDFSLVGLDRIEACKLFPSDHFGILCTFKLH